MPFGVDAPSLLRRTLDRAHWSTLTGSSLLRNASAWASSGSESSAECSDALSVGLVVVPTLADQCAKNGFFLFQEDKTTVERRELFLQGDMFRLDFLETFLGLVDL